MIKRHDVYYVGKFPYPVGDKRILFNKRDWDYLADALTTLSTHGDPVYKFSPWGKSATARPTFAVSRRDHKKFVNVEVEMLYWFFLGVMTTRGIEPY